MRILFWNTHNNAYINSTLQDLIIENNISIAILAEYSANIDDLITRLSTHGIKMMQYSSPGCDRIHVLGDVENVEFGPQSSHYSIQVLGNKDILCCLHLPSQLHEDRDRREVIIQRIINDIQKLEHNLNTENTIIVGDFNINPYDPSCINARYFHGIPIYEESARKTRRFAGETYSMFYNPMWNFFGDKALPYGTYYYDNSGAINTYWNIFDQVMIRPALKSRFVSEHLRIITETNNQYLLDNNNHPDVNISDHLPITFEIMEE